MLHKDDLSGRHMPHIHKEGPTRVPEGILGETVASKSSSSPKDSQPVMQLPSLPNFITPPRVGED